MPPIDSQAPGPLATASRPAQWGILLAASIVLAAVLELAGLPAALLLGPMIAGTCVGCNGSTIHPPKRSVLVAQTMVGCLVARAISGESVLRFLADWPLFLSAVVVIIITSGLLGWLLAQLKVLPGTAAVWGTAPGAASAMMVMAGEFGADARLVAFMQYLRVVMVAGMASVVARVWVGATGAAMPEIVWFPPLPLGDFAATLAIAALGAGVGIWLKVPGGGLLLPMILGAVLAGMGLVHITLPPWLLAITYALLGWNIGLGFTRDILQHVRRALPQVLMSIIALMSMCGLLAVILVFAAGIDPLTAYLATSPGGMDSIAIIGASSDVDLAFVMALQTVRFVIVLLAGPPLARLIAERVG